ncbi:uncharacterized protein [Ptychodera flava]|uniref:uncharacterized protein n=1 Tax=Ptychodera flava TaxID=63121 RepID=UPI00396A9DD5
MVSTKIKAVADINEKEVVDEKSSDSIQVTEQRPQVLKDCFPETNSNFLNHYPTNGRISKNGKSDIKVRVPAEETPKMTSSPADTILKDIGRDGQLHKDMESSSFEKEPHVKTEATLVLDKVVESKADSVADVVVDDFMDFTDSQLCSINEDWHVPSTSEIRTPAANHEIYNQSKTLAPSSTEQPFYVTMPSTHPSRNVSDEQATQKLTGLIEELAAINSMVLNAKREMDAFKNKTPSRNNSRS